MTETTQGPSFGERVGVDGVALVMYVQAVLGTLAFGLAGLFYLLGPVFIVAVGPGNVPDAIGMFVMSLIMCVFLFAIAIVSVGPYYVAGWALRSRKPWAHILGLVMAALSLANCPFGLIGGIVALMALTDPAVAAELKRGPVDSGEGWNE